MKVIVKNCQINSRREDDDDGEKRREKDGGETMERAKKTLNQTNRWLV